MFEDQCPSEIIRSFEIELSLLDRAFQGLAIETGGTIFVYDRDFPIRSIEFTEGDGILKSIFVQPIPLAKADGNEPVEGFALIMSAWKDDSRGRWSWHKVKAEFEHLPPSLEEQIALLDECLHELKAISLRDLTFQRVPGRGD